MRKKIITIIFLKSVFVGANSHMDSAPIYSAVTHWVTRVWAPSHGPLQILAPPPPTSFPVNIYCPILKKQAKKNQLFKIKNINILSVSTNNCMDPHSMLLTVT